MKIVITHLTRMQKGFICVAGVDLVTSQHVRPMSRSQMRKEMLARYGGPFDIGNIVDLGWTKWIGAAPELEDYLFHRDEARSLGEMPAPALWNLLRSLARPRLQDIFGKDLQTHGCRACGVAVGHGVASLGCFLPAKRPRLVLQRRDPSGGGRLRLQLEAGPHLFEVGLTDIRLYGADHVTPDPEMVQRVSVRLQDGPELLLGVGLTRPFRPTPEEPALHWLQVNNLHFADDPCWRLGRTDELDRADQRRP